MRAWLTMHDRLGYSRPGAYAAVPPAHGALLQHTIRSLKPCRKLHNIRKHLPSLVLVCAFCASTVLEPLPLARTHYEPAYGQCARKNRICMITVCRHSWHICPIVGTDLHQNPPIRRAGTHAHLWLTRLVSSASCTCPRNPPESELPSGLDSPAGSLALPDCPLGPRTHQLQRNA